tara:strand:+ start:95661 stop:96533 length:873 start_codon:yes stop_codon:yes gene_type:complete
MKKVLVMGGNHFFGIKLVQVLLDHGHDVTILNRGNLDDGFGERVKRIKCDRHNYEQLNQAIDENFDIVFDQSCFDYDQAQIACEIFNGRVSKYIFTSSISAYNELGANIKEELFDPYTFKFSKKETMTSNYGEAKRQAEVSFFKHGKFPVTAVRFPIVLDAKDATERLQFHVNRIKNKEEIFFPNIEARMSFISADDAAKALYALALNDYEGPINVASSDPISLKDFVELIEKKTGEKIIKADNGDSHNQSPYGIPDDWYVDCSKLESLGIKTQSIKDYLPKMIEEIVNE